MPRIEDDTGLVAATLAAAVRAMATKRGLIRDSLAEPLVRAVGWELFIRLAEGEAAVTDFSDLSDTGGYAAMTEGVAARTRFYDGFFADAGIAGIHQAVILNSGLDARPYRLWWPTETTVFDLDAPQIIEFKTQTLRRLGVTPVANRRAVGVDLREDWPAALRRAGFDSTRPSAWIAEGLLTATLPSDVHNRLLDDIGELSAAGSRFAADYGVSDEHNDVADYLRARGWVTVGATLDELLAAARLSRSRPDEHADAPIPTRYVTAVRNVVAPKTLDS
jgi:methyltransferase (TIGR00027 family)